MQKGIVFLMMFTPFLAYAEMEASSGGGKGLFALGAALAIGIAALEELWGREKSELLRWRG